MTYRRVDYPHHVDLMMSPSYANDALIQPHSQDSDVVIVFSDQQYVCIQTYFDNLGAVSVYNDAHC